MRLVFVSNYFNHHQKPLCEALSRAEDVDFVFYQTQDMDEERQRMGWGIDISAYPYVKRYRDNEEAAKRDIFESDLVIWGGVEMEEVIEPRLQAGKLTFRYSERIYKEGQWKFVSPRGLKKKYHDHIRYRKSPVYLLCAGAYVGSDFKLIHAYPKKKFVWGYFPEVKHYDLDELMAKKSREGEPVRILWAGRMIDWKHPEYALEAAHRLLCGGGGLKPEVVQRLKANGGFVLTMAGDGELGQTMLAQAREKGLQEHVRFTGYLSPEQIREEMERADIFLFTSDRKEGWGAVLNEAMNSGCLVIARYMIGAVPYLIQHGWNGMVADGDLDRFCSMVLYMTLERGDCREQGKRAYETMVRYWNAENAAAQFLRVAEGLMKGMESGKGNKKALLPEFAPEEEKTGALQPMCRDPEIRESRGLRFTKRW
ncbi:MAG: glycosyltransferase family 4 protein [Lachnospiraceae bacterium]|nr:glycosyltransferase family 4 protein [Lachnospiraceae bacterium]